MIFLCKTEPYKLRIAWFVKKCLVRHTGHSCLFKNKHCLILACAPGQVRDICKNIIRPVNTNRSCLLANSAIHSSSILENTFPEGFAGVLIIIPFVRGVTTLSRSSGENVQSGAFKPIYLGTASAARIVFIWYP